MQLLDKVVSGKKEDAGHTPWSLYRDGVKWRNNRVRV